MQSNQMTSDKSNEKEITPSLLEENDVNYSSVKRNPIHEFSHPKTPSVQRNDHPIFRAKTDEPSVRYHSNDHIAVICQMYASVWGQVLPYCFFMILLTLVILYTGKADKLDLKINDKGHTFMSVMVSFLIISRSHASLVRYMEARHLVGELMRCSRELIQHIVAFTRYERSKQARKWRAEISRRMCSLLRTVVVVLQHNKKREYVWQVAELTKAEKQALLLAVGGSNERSPLVLSIFIRTAISSHIECLDCPLDVNVELKLLSCTSDFISAYHGLMKLLNTPYPFPMLQMTRTFLFVWVFTLPFALANDIIHLVPLLFIVFFCTYGLELISIALEDPFGDDPMDFNVKALAEVVYSDIYVMIQDIDGNEASEALRSSVEMPLRDQIKSAVKDHKPYTRLKHWSGKESNTSMDKIAAKVSPILKMSSPTNPSLNSPLLAPLPPQLDFVGSSISPPASSLQSSRLLLSVQSQESDTSIDVYGTGERVKFSSTRNSLEISNRSHDSLNIPDTQPLFSDQETFMDDNAVSAETAPLLLMKGISSTDNRKSIVKTLYKESISPTMIHATRPSSIRNNDLTAFDYSSSFDDIADNHSSLMSSIRQRSDTDASIEIYGSNQKVKFNSSSNTIEVSQRFNGLNSTIDDSQTRGILLGKSDKPNKVYTQNDEQSVSWMDGGKCKTQSPINISYKKALRRPPNLPRQTSFGKRKDGEKDVENGDFR